MLGVTIFLFYFEKSQGNYFHRETRYGFRATREQTSSPQAFEHFLHCPTNHLAITSKAITSFDVAVTFNCTSFFCVNMYTVLPVRDN